MQPEFTVEGAGGHILPCKSKHDMVTAGVGLPRAMQFVVRMRVNESREEAVRRKDIQFAAAVAYIAGDTSASPQAAEAAPPRAPPPHAAPAALDARHSERIFAGVPEPRVSNSDHSARDDYDAQRLGSRHDRVRGTSYAEAIEQITDLTMQSEAWLHEVRCLPG